MNQAAGVVGFVLASTLALSNCPALASSDATGPSTTPSQDDVAALVRQLGSESFAVRQRATRQLIELGGASREALAQAAVGDDAEVRVRARAALTIVTDADFRRRLEAFASDYDGSRKQTLPAWDQFSAKFGTSRLARQMFTEMQRSEPELLEALAKGTKPASDTLQARCLSLSQQALQNPREGQIPLGTVASMLLVGATEGVSVDEQMGLQLYAYMIYQNSFQKNATSGVWSPILKKLLGNWVVRDATTSSAVQNLLFAALYDLKDEALLLATRALADEHNHSSTRQYAILVAGRFGDKGQLPMIEKLLQDKTNCGTFQVNNPPRQVELQIRDVALAVVVHLTGQNLAEYGYANAQTNSTTLFQVATLVFSDPARRDEALKKWSAWRSEHPQP